MSIEIEKEIFGQNLTDFWEIKKSFVYFQF